MSRRCPVRSVPFTWCYLVLIPLSILSNRTEETNFALSGFYQDITPHKVRLLSTEELPSLKVKWKLGKLKLYSFPVVDSPKNIVYISSGDGYLYALNSRGEILWKYDVKSFHPFPPVIGENGDVFLTVREGYLYALNPHGKLLWKLKINEGEIYSSPAIGMDGTLYFVGGLREIYAGFIYAITSEGKIKWKLSLNSVSLTTPVIGGDGSIYIGCLNGDFYAITPRGEIKWRLEIREPISIPATIGSEGTVLVPSLNGYLYAIDPRGNLKWRFKLRGGTCSSPKVSKKGIVFASSCSGLVYAIDPDGNLNWYLQTGAMGRDFLLLGQNDALYLALGERLFILSPQGELKCENDFGKGASIAGLALGPDKTLYVGIPSVCALDTP